MKAALDHADKLTDRVVTFWFKPERKFRFEPGQFVEIRIPHQPMDNREIPGSSVSAVHQMTNSSALP